VRARGRGAGARRDLITPRTLKRAKPPRGRERAKAHERDAKAPRPLRLFPDTYIAHTQPGLEAVALSEIAARVPGARESGHRVVPERAGMTIFTAPRPEALSALRCAEDVFALVGYRARLDPDKSLLDRIRAAAREAPFVREALDARVRFLPGVRAGRRLRFRVVARQAGEHEFRRVDLQHAVERGIQERLDHTWRLDEQAADLEVWATMIGAELFLAIRLSDDTMRHREYKTAHLPGSLRPAAAAALAWLSEPDDRDVVLDPFCGAGTILIERAHLGRYARLIGSDHDPAAIRAARANVGPRYKPIDLEGWDAGAIPLGDASVNAIITNLPWGARYSTHGENRRLYPDWIAEFDRLLAVGGRMVLLTAEWRIMQNLISRGRIRPERIIRANILGTSASVYVIRKS
jgi:tRNA (guanine6-N2)-methyltransferase